MLILVADDELRLRKVIALYMRKSGFEVMEAASCEIALKLIAERRPDVIILDIVMPGGMNGIEATKLIKSDKSISSIPLILLSANASEAEIEEAKKSGVDRYLTKPFSPKELLNTATELYEKSLKV